MHVHGVWEGGGVILVFSYLLSVIGRWVVDFIDLGNWR